MANGILYSDGKNDPVLNVSTSAYKGLYYTLGRKDGNNNGNPSRANRPALTARWAALSTQCGANRSWDTPSGIRS